MNLNTLRINIANIDPQFEVFGSLSLADDETPIPYIPYQMSKYGIGVIARSGLDVLADLSLKTPNGSVIMRVLSVEPNGGPENGARYSLLAVGLNLDLEHIYSNDSKVRAMVGEASLHFARFQTNPAARMLAKTFGSTNPYSFKTINASKSGVYVVSENNKSRIPFRESTLIEWSFSTNDSWLLRPVSGVGRVAHQSTHEGQSGMRLQYFGLELKEFRGDSDAIWRQALENLERQTIDRQLKEASRSA